MDQTSAPISTPPNKPSYNPLYLQVKQQLIERIAGGEWIPGSALPSEQQLARQMEVSQGTVRKALDVLAAENLLVRRQGRGTFVAEHDQQRTLFQFFKIAMDDGRRQFPETEFAKLSIRRALRRERKLLDLPAAAKVWRLVRYRSLDGRVRVVERISLSADAFPDLDKHEPLPNNVYRLYERSYATTITNAVERLRAVGAGREDARALGCAEGDPVLSIDRIAYGLTGNTVELRQSICLTDAVHYLSDLS